MIRPPPDLDPAHPHSRLPATRALRLQALTRADEGFISEGPTSTQRGYARQPTLLWQSFASERSRFRDGHPRSWALPSDSGEITVTECETNQPVPGALENPTAAITRAATGLVSFGMLMSAKAISMALLTGALRWKELARDNLWRACARTREFVLITPTTFKGGRGFWKTIKLPHYRRFPVRNWNLIRKLRPRPHRHT